jgi:hypothetical protein
MPQSLDSRARVVGVREDSRALCVLYERARPRMGTGIATPPGAAAFFGDATVATVEHIFSASSKKSARARWLRHSSADAWQSLLGPSGSLCIRIRLLRSQCNDGGVGGFRESVGGPSPVELEIVKVFDTDEVAAGDCAHSQSAAVCTGISVIGAVSSYPFGRFVGDGEGHVPGRRGGAKLVPSAAACAAPPASWWLMHLTDDWPKKGRACPGGAACEDCAPASLAAGSWGKNFACRFTASWLCRGRFPTIASPLAAARSKYHFRTKTGKKHGRTGLAVCSRRSPVSYLKLCFFVRNLLRL